MEEFIKLQNDFLKEQEENKHNEVQDNKYYLVLINHVLNKLS